MSTGGGRFLVWRAASLARFGATWSLIIALALASSGWTWSVEEDESTLKVKRDKLSRTVFPAAGTAFFVCDVDRVATEQGGACKHGTFRESDGTVALDLDQISEDVASWCLVVDDKRDSCVPLPNLAHVARAHRAAALCKNTEYRAGAAKYREAAKQSQGLVRSSVSRWDQWYEGQAVKCEEKFVGRADTRAKSLLNEGKPHEAIEMLEDAIKIATRHKLNSYEVGVLRESASKLRNEYEKHQREIASVRKSCKLVGEANDLLPGAAEQRVWLCKRDVVTDKDTGGTVEVIDLVVEDGARVLVHDELVGTMYMDEHVEARVRLADITGTKAPEMLVDTIGECGVRSLAVMQVDEDGKLQAVWSMETSVSNLESDCGSGDWAGQWDQAWWPQFRGEPTPPKIELADGHFLWASEPMVWVEESKSFVPSQAGLDRYREQEIERVRKLLAEGHPGVAHAILPDDAPKELVRDIEIGCERVFLKALNDAKPINEMGQKANPEEARALKLEMLEYGLQCAPESQALNRSIKSLRAQVEADNKRRALEYEKRAKKDRIALFQRQSLGGIGFGMTRAAVQNLCREQKGRWDGSSSTLVGCDRGPVTFGAGLCGDRVCSIYLSNPSPWRKDLGHQAMLEHYQRRFGEGEHSSAGAAKVVKWKIDARRSIKVTLSHIRGRDLLMVALHSKGER